jgi:hypothetical protein
MCSLNAGRQVGTRPRKTQNSAATLFVLWLTIAFSFCYVHPRKLDVQMALSRLDLLHAIVVQKTFNIDSYENNTPDKAVSKGHYYCDKAPGVAFLAFPSFYVSSKILSVFGVGLETDAGWLWSEWLSVATAIGALSAVGSVCLFLWLQGFMHPRCALLCTLVTSWGSVMFPYSTMMLSHSLVVGLFAIALFSLRLGWRSEMETMDAKSFAWRDFWGGMACGLAIACEYDAALVAGGILAVVFADNIQRGYRLILGASSPLLLIPLYNWVCLGNPFSLPYAHETYFTDMHKGFYGIHLPDIGNFAHLMVSPERGLFFWTPFLFLAFPG